MASLPAAALNLESVEFSYTPGTPVLRIKQLQVEARERVFVFGPSGSGKTTLLGLLAGVLKANSGKVGILGRDLTAMSNAQRDAFRGSHVGYVFQLFNLIPYLSVVENIVLPCKFSAERKARLKDASLEAAARRVATRLGIDSLLHQNVARLSVGQQQRVAAARALIGTPELVIADEPTSSLDYDHRERFISLLFECCEDAGSTLVFVSHDRSLMPLFHRTVSLGDINEVKG